MRQFLLPRAGLNLPLLGLSLALLVGCSRSTSPYQPLSAKAAPLTVPATTRTIKVAVEPEVFPVPVVELDGSGADLGLEHARKMDKPIHLLLKNYLRVYIGGGAH